MFRQNTLFCQLCKRPISGRYLRYSNGLIVCAQCEQTTPRCVRCNLPSHQLTKKRDGQFCPDCLREAPTCDLCHEPMPGSYQVYNSTLKVCAVCQRTVARCARCNIPSRQLTVVRGVGVCPACLQKAPVCDLCHKPVLSSYQVYKGNLNVCAECERTVAHCARCHVPSRQLTPVRGEGVCAECLQAMPVCACCRIPILGRYSTFEQLPESYCETCMQTRPRCGICSVPINEQGQVIRQGEGETVRCARCLRTAIKTEQEAEPLYRRVRALLAQQPGLTIDVLPALTLLERAGLERVRQEKAAAVGINRPPGNNELHTEGFFHRHNDQQNIYIEHYLPRTRFQGVAAHELAHAWQAAHAPRHQPERIVEGFAEWVAYSVLQALGERAEAERLAKRDDLYGEGLRYFLDLERRGGRQAVIERAKR